MSEKEQKKEAKQQKKAQKRRIVSWEEVTGHVYDRIGYYASRFVLTSVYGVVIGFVVLVYGILNIIFFGIALEDLAVFVAVFIGLGFIVASLIILGWGIFWRKKVDNRSIFKE